MVVEAKTDASRVSIGGDAHLRACHGQCEEEEEKQKSTLLCCWASDAAIKVSNVFTDATTLQAIPGNIF